MEWSHTIKPVYMRNRDIQTNKGKFYSDFDIAEAASGVVSDVLCVQRDRDLWRIYIKSAESRDILVNEGFTLGSRAVQVFDTNPYSAGTDSPDEKVVRVLVKGIPLSVEDSCVKNMLEGLGAKLTSDIKYEKIRHPITHRMTEILNGNRFVYMSPLENDAFLPRSAVCAGLRCTIAHKGQPMRERKKQCTNCWADDHYRNNCEYEQCCRICKQTGHFPGSPKCRLYVSEQDDIVCFSGKDNPLSNFFPSDLKVFGQTFPSAEHAFQHVKSLRSGDLSRAEAIRKSETALDAKRLGSQVLESDAWISSKDTVMREILEAKLQQCAKFKDALANVKKTDILVESTWDSYWGSGLNLTGTSHTVMQHWPGQNRLGRLLAGIASQLQRTEPTSDHKSGPSNSSRTSARKNKKN